MDKNIESEIVKVINEFEAYFFLESHKRRVNNSENKEIQLSFTEFIAQEKYIQFSKKVEDEIRSNSHSSLEELVYSCLTEEQRTRIGGLFHQAQEEKFSNHDSDKLNTNADIIDKLLINSELYQGFISSAPHYNKEERTHLANEIAKLLYQQLDPQSKKLLRQTTIKKFLLNVGFMERTRGGYFETLEFTVKYKSLFKNPEHVLDTILTRYIDDELSKTPIEKTKDKIQELKSMAKELYTRIKNGT